MGADWYRFVSTTIVAIPIPKEALKSEFEKEGFRIMTIKSDADDYDSEFTEYHGAFLCLEDTIEIETSLEAIGPCEIKRYAAESKRIDNMDKYLPDDVKDTLIKEYESFVGEKPEFTPGFWMVSCTSDYHIDLHSKWVMGAEDKLASEKSKRFAYGVRM
ncbi:hypothetical protein BGZ58_011131 [Dissophora ornata]|nr:hypothetical protein BGZ58_011131 [Dissophora ornata]